MSTTRAERPAELGLSGWHGVTWTSVLIVGETPQRFRIKAPEGQRVKLAGRNRWIEGDITALVPKHAIREPHT